jgi:hypothetical protein
MNLLEESVSIPTIYNNDGKHLRCDTYYPHGTTSSQGYIRVYGLAKRSDDTWKLSNSMRRKVRDKIIIKKLITANTGGIK